MVKCRHLPHKLHHLKCPPNSKKKGIVQSAESIRVEAEAARNIAANNLPLPKTATTIIELEAIEKKNRDKNNAPITFRLLTKAMASEIGQSFFTARSAAATAKTTSTTTTIDETATLMMNDDLSTHSTNSIVTATVLPKYLEEKMAASEKSPATTATSGTPAEALLHIVCFIHENYIPSHLMTNSSNAIPDSFAC
jgi:hypothetical protein